MNDLLMVSKLLGENWSKARAYGALDIRKNVYGSNLEIQMGTKEFFEINFDYKIEHQTDSDYPHRAFAHLEGASYFTLLSDDEYRFYVKKDEQ